MLEHPAIEESHDLALVLDHVQAGLFLGAHLGQGLVGEVGLEDATDLAGLLGVDLLDEKLHQRVDRLAVLWLSSPDQHF